jgi:hypothetical protein
MSDSSRVPFTNFPGATVRGPLAPVGGYVYVTDAVLGNTMQQAACIQIQSTAAFTVEVVGPIGSFLADPPHSPYPGPGPSSGGANEIVLIRGRWQSIRVATTGNVYVMIDTDLRAYGGL